MIGSVGLDIAAGNCLLVAIAKARCCSADERCFAFRTDRYRISVNTRHVFSVVHRRCWLQHQGLSGPSHRQGAGKYFNTIEIVTIAYEVSIDQQYGYGVCCKLVLKYYDYILLLLFVVKE